MSMSLPPSTTVLVVGAGPTGLAIALSLLHHCVRDFVLVDAVLQGGNSSRASVIHAATIETLDKIDAANDLLERGIKVEDVHLCTRTRDLVHANFSLLRGHTSHPYSLLLPQNITEGIFVQKLRRFGVHVHRPCRVVGMCQSAKDGSMTDVLFEDGQIISATYVIGADGARSTVRSAAGIGFADPDGDTKEHMLTQMILADVTFTREPDPKRLFNGVLSPDNWFVLLNWTERFNEDLAQPGKPIRGSVYRIGCGIPVKCGAPPAAPPKEYIQSALNAYGPTFLSSDSAVNPKAVEIDQVVWSTRFRTHSAIADRTFTRLGSGAAGSGEGGVVLLVGDAAHIHSPAGGQGMNLGLRDAVYLGGAISEHIRAASGRDAMLRGHVESRRERALGVIAFTKRYMRFVSMPYASRWWMPISPGLIRDVFIRFFGNFTFLQARVAWGISGLGFV